MRQCMDNSSKCQASLVPQGFLLLCFQIPVIQPQLHPCSSPLHLPYPTDVVVDSAQGHSHSSLTDYTEASSNTEWSCVRPVKSAPHFVKISSPLLPTTPKCLLFLPTCARAPTSLSLLQDTTPSVIFPFPL